MENEQLTFPRVIRRNHTPTVVTTIEGHRGMCRNSVTAPKVNTTLFFLFLSFVFFFAVTVQRTQPAPLKGTFVLKRSRESQ